jgi:hypothetical protein
MTTQTVCFMRHNAILVKPYLIPEKCLKELQDRGKRMNIFVVHNRYILSKRKKAGGSNLGNRETTPITKSDFEGKKNKLWTMRGTLILYHFCLLLHLLSGAIKVSLCSFVFPFDGNGL